MPADLTDRANGPGCGHGFRNGCIYCPICGVRYPTQERRRGVFEVLFAPLEFVARIFAPTSMTPELDVASNLEAIRSGDPDRIRASLGFLLELAPQARRIRDEVEKLQDHGDRDIALRARDLIAAMEAV